MSKYPLLYEPIRRLDEQKHAEHERLAAETPLKQLLAEPSQLPPTQPDDQVGYNQQHNGNVSVS